MKFANLYFPFPNINIVFFTQFVPPPTPPIFCWRRGDT
jgi:hypothetical protein